jgi:hypothetical protein
LLNFLLSNCLWEDGELVATFRQPFDLLAQTTIAATRLDAEGRPDLARSETWLTSPVYDVGGAMVAALEFNGFEAWRTQPQQSVGFVN